MKRLIILSGCLILFSCSQNEKVPVVSSALKKDEKATKLYPSKFGLIFDTAYFDHDEIKVDTIKYLIDSPKITPLPFGYDFDKKGLNAANNDELLYEHNYHLPNQEKAKRKSGRNYVYKLPPISKLKYISVSSVDTDKCNDGKLFADYLRLKTYTYRLPDINGYQCYFWGEKIYGSKFPEKIRKNCEWCILTSSVGYIIFYDPKTSNAKTIAASYSTSGDTDHERYFYMDKNFDIHLVDLMYDEDGDPKGSIKSHVEAKYVLKTAKSGDVLIKRIN